MGGKPYVIPMVPQVMGGRATNSPRVSAIPESSSHAEPLPNGTITFAFTDIEGSTQRWDRDRAAMEAAVRRHDALMREAIAAHNGYVFKTVGDAFCAAFPRPEDAVGAMLDAQRALGAEDFSAIDGLRVRAAIHTGTADERDRDYFGPPVNRVARLLGIAHGGQVLVSGVTSDLVQGSLPPQASLRDLGEHRLKDLSRPEYVYQLLGPGLIADFPPLRSLDALPNNLPHVATSFIGRENDVGEITALLAKHHLVTLVGSGGVGKTRTSLQVAANLLDGSGDGVWFIELAPLAVGDLIPGTVASAMGMTLPTDGDSTQHLVRALHNKRALLVFDNCEHLVEASARVVAAIVRGCPQVTILASSRQGLGIAGEATYRMPPMTTPRGPEGASLSAADASRYTAIALFTERASASDNRFTLTDENAPMVADICTRLDGIALAIELAAARVKILSPRQLSDRLNERFRVLTGGSRDALPRQQTLRALIDWSHDLLEDRERTVFRRLGIFVDGFTLEGAAAVASSEDIDELDIFELVASLADKSLVLAEPNGDALRYRLLESTRAYALEKLRDAGERDVIAGRHLRYLRDWLVEIADRVEATLRTADRHVALKTELEGVRFALDDALARFDVVAGAELLAAISTAWPPLGMLGEGRARIETFISALPDGEALLRAELSATLAYLLLDQCAFVRALESATNACVFARRSENGPSIARSLAVQAVANSVLGNFTDADTALREAAAIPLLSTRLRSSIAQARTELNSLSGDNDASARDLEQMLVEQRALGNLRNVHTCMFNLSIVEERRGNTARAIALLRELRSELNSEREVQLRTMALSALTGMLVTDGEFAEAMEAAHGMIETLAREPDNMYVTGAIEGVALVDALLGRFTRAACLSSYTELAVKKVGYKRSESDQRRLDQLIALLEANLSPEERARLEAEGAALTPEAAVALVLGGDTTL
jgi:predicted ATPase/class 3 adenylate cyclase